MTSAEFGSPFVNEGSGRIKTDQDNERNITQILNNFHSDLSTHPELKQQFKYSITQDELKVYSVMFPLIGFTVGAVGSLAFVHPNSKYIGKFFTLATTAAGFMAYRRACDYHQHSYRVGNFSRYPEDIRKTLDNNDFRYARRWLAPNHSEYFKRLYFPADK